MNPDEWKIERNKDLAEAAARRKTPFVYAGVDLRAEARKYCRALGITMPGMKVRHGATHGSSGRAWRSRIVITLGPNAPVAHVLELLLHELTHVATPGHHHDETFCATLVRTARQLWGLKVDGWLSLPRGDRRNRAYAIDNLIRVELADRLMSLDVQPVLVPVPAVVPVVSLAERRETLVQKREERARKALAKAEAELHRVQKRLSKWKVKVRYYERRAAAKVAT